MRAAHARRIWGTNAALSVVAVLGILVAVNFLSYRHFVRADLTENREFTITESTKRILRGLDDVVNVRVYFTAANKLPSRLVGLEQEVKDLLDEYRAFSGGNLNIEFIDPEDNPEDQMAARQLGIAQVPLQVIEKDKMQVLNAYLGIAVLYEDKSEVMPQVLSVRNLEYDITSRILKVTRKDEPTVGFLTGHEEKSLDKDLQALRKALEEQYRVVEVQGGRPVPDGVRTLVVVGPKRVPDRDQYEIDQFLMRGGRGLFLVDPVDMVPGMLQARVLQTGLEDMLGRYGVTLRKELVVDPVSATASFNMGFLTFSVPYPFWPRVVEAGLDPNTPVVSELGQIVFPWAGPLDVGVAGDSVSGRNVVVLAKSSPGSWTQKGSFNLSPQQRFGDVEGEKSASPLAVALTGRFESFFAGKDVPAAEGTEPTPVPASSRLDRSEETTIVVVGCSQFASDDFLMQYPTGGVFLLNAIDWLTMGGDLIGIRSRSVTTRPLREVSEGAKSAVKFVNIFGVPVLVIAYGLVRVLARRRSRKAFAAYGA